MACYHTVQPGEYLMSIARSFGFEDWHLIYDHPNNAELCRRRPDPNTLNPGDRIYIPDKNPRKDSIDTGKRHKYILKNPGAFIDIVLKDSLDQPLANMNYAFTVGDELRSGATDNDGRVHASIPVGIENAKLQLEDIDLTVDVRVGHLDPVWDLVDEAPIIKGVQGRLNNLGYHCGHVDGLMGPKTKAAIRRFQHLVMKRKDADGEPDSETCKEIQKRHGA